MLRSKLSLQYRADYSMGSSLFHATNFLKSQRVDDFAYLQMSDAEDVHERVQNLHHSDAMNDSLACSNCTDPLKECRDAYVAEFLKLDDIHKKCPILSKYVDCVSEVRQYDQDDKIKVLKKLRARMKKERIYCGKRYLNYLPQPNELGDVYVLKWI
ncbi:hypothetical protein PoB_006886500 [Plakobranchus ocellatus]|uniref:Uncharacterized protein n=1 Tax=Plakobranchus ocellatus TaxID=259542 RepID=A0AAV4DEG6_9GAST|nr:hypothetical protein PoB_006886500 [Plakobranchus ocellatus]